MAVGGVVGGLVSSAGSGTRTVQAIVADSVNHTLSAKTAQLNFELKISTPSGTVTASGPGVLDFSRGAMSATLQMDLAGRTTDISTVYVGGAVYEQVPGLSHLEPGKTWITIDLSSLINSTGSAQSGMLSSNPLAGLELLARQGATVSPAGATTIDGQTVQAYQITITSQTIQSRLSAPGTPEWLRSAVGKVAINDIHETVYIGQGQLRRALVDFSEQVSGQTITFEETMDLSAYGMPVTISVPPASQTVDFQKLLHDAQAAG